MKHKFTKILIVAGLALAVLAGCAIGPRAESTPGISADDSAVYVAYMQYAYKIDAKTGAEAWRYPAKGSTQVVFYAPPLASNGKVYIGDFANRFHDIDAQTGLENWAFSQAKGWFQTKPVIDGDQIIAPNTDRNVYAIGTDGSLKWTYSSQFAFLAEPVIVDNTIVIGSQEHKIVSLDKSTGAEVWAKTMKGAVIAAPLYDPASNSLFVGSLGKEMVCLDSKTGEVKWEFSADNSLSSVWATPILINDQLIFSDESGKVLALNPQSGELIWSMEAGSNMVAGVVAIPDGFVLSLENGTLSAYDLSRNPKWTKTIKGQIFNTPVLNGETIYVGAIKGDALVYAFDLNGTQLWSFTPAK